MISSVPLRRPRRGTAVRLVSLCSAVLLLASCSGSPTSAPRSNAASALAPASAATTSGFDGDLDHLGSLLSSRPAPVTAAPVVAPGESPPPPSGPPYTTGPRPGSPVVIPPPALPPGDGTVYAVGDSVLLGAANFLPTTMGGWDLRIDARVSRRTPEGLSVIQQNRASLGQVAVVLLGHNYGGGGSFAGTLDRILYELRGVQRVVLVTVAEFAPAQVEVNRAIWASTFRYANVVVADWAGTVRANPQFLVSDRVHPNTSGQIALANLIAVLVGPAPARFGVIPPPPKILPIPDSPAPSGPAPSTTAPPGATTTAPPTSSSSTTSSTTSSLPPDPSSSTTTTSAVDVPPASVTDLDVAAPTR